MNALRVRLLALWLVIFGWYAGHSRRDQRIILAVLGFAAICLVYLWGWVPLRDYRQRVADEIAEGQEQLRRAVRIIGSADSLRAERESLDKKLKVARERLLPGRGATLGAAALQERANALAAEKGITVQSTQVMKDEALDPYRKVAIRLTLSGELKPFAELVSGLEFGQQLAVPVVEINRRGAVPGAKGPRTLSATVEVSGFVLAEDAKAEEGGAAEGGDTAADGAGVAPGAAVPATEGTPPGAPAAPTGTTGAVLAPTGTTGAVPSPPSTARAAATTTTVRAAAPTTTVRAARPTSTTRPAAQRPVPLPRATEPSEMGEEAP